ncbi:MAG: hypothetical protein KC503_22300 [Myxococcales bacterium]|nr:hypothetical protein [Myxococcales bacterium]
MSEGSAEKSTCSCGFDKDHYMVSKEGEYTVAGWFSHTVGISTRPKLIKYRCRVCGDIIEETTDPTVLRGGIR